MSTNDSPNQSGGGIVFGGGSRSTPRPASNASGIASTLRRRWASGIAVVTAVDPETGYRGVTATSLMVVSQEPAIIAIALTAGSSFQYLATVDAVLGVSVLDAVHEFSAERFAGRAPVPDGRFTGIAHHVEDSVPILDGALGWCLGRVRQREAAGDHVLVLLEIIAGGFGADTDDPLLSYEGRYRRLEAG